MAGLDEAAAFVERARIALIYPQADLVLPPLREAVADGRDFDWAIRDAEGRFVDFTPEFGAVRRWPAVRLDLLRAPLEPAAAARGRGPRAPRRDGPAHGGRGLGGRPCGGARLAAP
ncbi:hypothetical protein [Gaiella sp.]|jgi:hypothetical protein|uniref:hypothetical protein n=1 Tax=Gaiella sp. TaxID=2663207 RepID=UPI002D98ACF4|nr:hypothetical protein [Gaiella sp.]HET7045925.1 hypothetical protein [Gaiellaceae bacterium]HEX5583002.1 hypothetical protein [Gaiella sp.]